METVKISFGEPINIGNDTFVFNPSDRGRGYIEVLKLLPIADIHTIDEIKELPYMSIRARFLSKGIRISL